MSYLDHTTKSAHIMMEGQAISMSTIVCDICPRACRLREGETGPCGVRANIEGKNVDVLYQRVFPPEVMLRGLIAYLPGCNLWCWFCAVYSLWKRPIDTSRCDVLTEQELVDLALAHNTGGIGFFGGEAALHHEYVMAVAKLCRKRGLGTILPTSGFISEWLAKELAPLIQQPVVGIKASGNPTVYGRMKADPEHCLRIARAFWEGNKQTEITTLIGPGMETSQDNKRFAAWVKENIAEDVQVRLEVLTDSNPVASIHTKYNYVGGIPTAQQRAFKVGRELKEAGLTNVRLPIICGVGGPPGPSFHRTV